MQRVPEKVLVYDIMSLSKTVKFIIICHVKKYVRTEVDVLYVLI